MTEKKKTSVDYFPDFNYRYFPVVFEDKEMEGIQGPVYAPSGEILSLGADDTITMPDPVDVFHDGDAKVYDLETKMMDFGNATVQEEKVADAPEVLGYIPCPNCSNPIGITSSVRPLKINCGKCGKKGTLK